MARFLDDLSDSSQFYFSNKVSCIDKAVDQKYLYNHILVIMVNRMLKLID